MPVVMSPTRSEAPQSPRDRGQPNTPKPGHAEPQDRTEPALQRTVAAAPVGVGQALSAAPQPDKNARNLQRARDQQATQRAACVALNAPKSYPDSLYDSEIALAQILDPISAKSLGPIKLSGARAIWAEFRGEPTWVAPKTKTQALGSYTVGEAHEQGRRPSMEDASVVRWFDSERMGIVGLFDGHGGMTRAVYAAQMVPEVFAQHLARLSPSERLSYPAVAATLKNAMAPPERRPGRVISNPPGRRLLTVHEKMKAFPKQLRTWAHQEYCTAKAEQREFNKALVEAAHTEAHAGSTALVAVFL